MKVALYILPLLTLLFFSCKKEPDSGPTTAEGRVLNGVSSAPIAFADVFLLRQPSGGFHFQQVQSVRASEDGRYSLSFEADKDYSYYLAATTSTYRESSYQSISSGRRNKKDLYLEPKGWLRLTFVNAPPLDTVDYIYVNFSGNHHFNVSDTVSTVIEGFGGRLTPVSYFITRNGIETNYQEEFYCAPHTTTQHYIYY